MLVIRLTRFGKKKRAFYRLVVADKKAPIKGKYIAQIGYYNPLVKTGGIFIDKEKAKKWLSQGAQPSNTAWNLLVEAGVLKKKIVTQRSKKRKEKKEIEEKATATKMETEEEKQTSSPEEEATSQAIKEKPLVPPSSEREAASSKAGPPETPLG